MKSPYQQAHELFEKQLPDLLAQGHCGQWVLLHAGTGLLRIDDSRDALYQIAREAKLPEDEILVDMIVPEVEDIDSDIMRCR
jgi:hypothetical protein